MAGRNRLPRRQEELPPHFRAGPPPFIPHERGPVPLQALDEEFIIRRDEIHRLLADKWHLVEETTVLRREGGAIKEELHNVSQVIPRVRADKEAQARDLIQRGLKLEADLRVVEAVKMEILQLQTEAQKLDAPRQEMLAKIKGMSQDLKRLQAENEQIPTLRGDIDGLRQELVRARTAFEYEKKRNAEQVQQRDVMEKNLLSMAHELEKLQAEHETRARGPGGAFGMLKASPDVGYPGSFSSEKRPYGAGPWDSHDPHDLPCY